jgi:hypothetical protein
MDPTFINGRTQKYAIASGAIVVVAVRAGRGLFFLFITTDETWVHYFTPESKRSSVQWRHPVSETQKIENHVLCWEGYGHTLLGL